MRVEAMVIGQTDQVFVARVTNAPVSLLRMRGKENIRNLPNLFVATTLSLAYSSIVVSHQR
jgi:hypothetical protein